ncbi:MAG TPA: glycerophosphodiester phosphodiesterase [Spirochaetota bacterium]|nr:glycerophosphodiester phosphodiesterase [Spirochaetota bacterium]
MQKQFFTPEPRIFAHRGISSEYPENSVLSFRKAVAIHADVIETDIHFTKDNKFVVFHDDKLERLTNGKGKVTDYTLQDLKTLDIGYNFTLDTTTYPYRGKNLTFMSLDEMLEEFPDQRFNIDLKDKNTRQVPLYCETIVRHNAQHRVLTASSYRRNLTAVRKTIPEMATSAGLWEALGIFFLFKAGILFTKKNFSMDALQIPEFIGTSRVVSEVFVHLVHQKGLRVHVWTVNREEDMKRIIGLGVDAVMSDYPALLQKVYEAMDQDHSS